MTEKPLSFEQALQQLQALVEDMEQAQLPLEELLNKYEAGLGLLKKCEETLNQAQQKLETIHQQLDPK